MSKYKPLDINKNYRADINTKLDNKLLVDACLSVYQYIEYYLKDWLILEGKKTSYKLLNIKYNELDHLKVDQLVQVHLFLDHIDLKLYYSIQKIKKLRHKFAHNLINIDYNNSSEIKKYESIIKDAIYTCDIIFDKYMCKLKEESKDIS